MSKDKKTKFQKKLNPMRRGMLVALLAPLVYKIYNLALIEFFKQATPPEEGGDYKLSAELFHLWKSETPENYFNLSVEDKQKYLEWAEVFIEAVEDAI